MQSQLRVMQLRAVRPAQRRAMATIPPTPPPSGAAPVRPVVVTTKVVPTPGSSTLPPPPPPGGSLPPPPLPPRRGFFRRFLLYTSLSALVFYPVSGLIGTKSETYREFFTETFPGGEYVADQVENLMGPQPRAISTTSRVDQAVKDARAEAEAKARAGKATLEQKSAEAKGAAQSAAQQAQKKAEEAKAAAASKAEEAKAAAASKAEEAKAAASKKAEEAKAAAAKKAADVKSAASDAAAKAEDEVKSLKDRVVQAATDAKDKVAETAKSVPFNAGDGLEGLVRKAEGAVEKGEKKLESAVEAVKEKVDPNAPRVLPDTQRPRELRPETVTPAKPSFEGKEKYTGELPLGFEPPPGYYIPPPPKVEGAKVSDKTMDAKPVLPLLAPKVKDFAIDEPIISQLASTIDSLASSLSAPGGAAAGASGVLTKAQADLTALSTRLSEVKKAEKAKLEKALADKAKEFEATLKNAEKSMAQTEQGLQDKWVKEREGMVAEWKNKMETELEGQREGIEKRLREEVVSQGIELQRRWLRSIKAQVEEERGGRLAKLDHLSTSLKQLERITLDNSATLDDNVRVHKVWSALRAVQSKAEQGDVSFDEELRVLKALASPSSASDSSSTGAAAVEQLEQSGVALTGVKSLSALSSWFTTSVSPRVHSASLVPSPEKAGVVSHLASWSLSNILFKPRAGPVVGSDVSAVLARAEWCLAEKDLDGAAREINRLQGWPGKLAADWLREARRALEVRQALDIVATEATLGSLLLV